MSDLIAAHAELQERFAELEAEVARLTECEEVASRANAELIKENASLQAKIDALMLEYCPEDMDTEQMIEWADNQVPGSEITGNKS